MIGKTRKADPNVWVFGEWFGKKCSDNCAYFANYVARVNTNIKIYWIAKENTDTSKLDRRIDVLLMDSKSAKNVLKNAGAIIVGQGLRDVSTHVQGISRNAVTINLWHGIPWKKIGHSGSKKKGILFKLYCKLADYALNCEFYVIPSEAFIPCYEAAFGAHEENLILAGQPRNVDLYNTKFCQESKFELIRELNLPSDARIIAYMPTFRDKVQDTFSFLSLLSNSEVTECLENHGAVIVEKAHFVNMERKSHETIGNGRIYSLKGWDAQKLLAAADVLITDYSGAAFDFLLLNRPIIYYLYDYAFYLERDRGLYFPKESVVAGNVASNMTELLVAMEKDLQKPNGNDALRNTMRQRYMRYDTPKNNETIYRRIQFELQKRAGR